MHRRALLVPLFVLLSGLALAEGRAKEFSLAGRTLEFAAPEPYCLMRETVDGERQRLADAARKLAPKHKLVAAVVRCDEQARLSSDPSFSPSEWGMLYVPLGPDGKIFVNKIERNVLVKEIYNFASENNLIISLEKLNSIMEKVTTRFAEKLLNKSSPMDDSTEKTTLYLIEYNNDYAIYAPVGKDFNFDGTYVTAFLSSVTAYQGVEINFALRKRYTDRQTLTGMFETQKKVMNAIVTQSAQPAPQGWLAYLRELGAKAWAAGWKYIVGAIVGGGSVAIAVAVNGVRRRRRVAAEQLSEARRQAWDEIGLGQGGGGESPSPAHAAEAAPTARNEPQWRRTARRLLEEAEWGEKEPLGDSSEKSGK